MPFIIASALIFGVFLPKEAAARTTAKDLVGTWTLVPITLEQDGKKTDFYGPDPQGQATYEANGRVSVIITRSDLPKFALSFNISGDQVNMTSPTSSTGTGSNQQVWKRAKWAKHRGGSDSINEEIGANRLELSTHEPTCEPLRFVCDVAAFVLSPPPFPASRKAIDHNVINRPSSGDRASPERRLCNTLWQP